MIERSAPEQDVLRSRFKAITETALPARARSERWPLRLDHCFKRVCLDWACNDCWYGHIQRPAERHLAGALLDRAVTCAEELLNSDVHTLQERNEASLRWRGKTVPRRPRASEIRRGDQG